MAEITNVTTAENGVDGYASPAKRKRKKYKSRKQFFLPDTTVKSLSRRQIAMTLDITARTLDKMIACGEYPTCDFRTRNEETGDPRWLEETHNTWLKSKKTK